MSKMKSSNDLVAKLFETIESKVKKTGDDDSTDVDSSDSDDDSSISLSLSSSSDEKSKSKSSKKSKKSKKKKKKKTSSKKKKRKHSSDSSSDSGDEKVKKSKKKKKKHSKDKHKDKDDKEALHKKLKLNDKMSSLDDIFTNKRKSSIDDTGVANKKAKLDKSSEKNKNTFDLGVNEAILGAIEKEMSENASQTISEILDDLLGSDKSRINEKKLLEDSLLNVKIKKEKEDDFTKAINIKKEKVDKLNESTSEKSQEKSERKEEKESEISQNNHHSDKEDEGKAGMSEGIEGEKKSDGDNKKGDKSDEEKTDEEIPLPPVADVFVEDLLASKAATEIVKANTDKVKPPTGKITIGNLKQPTVFKEIEDAEKQRRSKYEDGEITPSEGEDDKSESDKHRKEKRKKSSSSKSRRGSDRTSRHRKHRSRDTSRSRSRDRSSKSYHHSATSSSRLRHRRGRSSRSRSVSRDRTRDRERDRDGRRSSRLKSRRSSRSISLSLSPPGRRKSKSPIDSAAKIDKRKLLEIARKNAVNMMKEGVITGDKRKLISWKAGGSTVNELTDFCKLLAKQEGEESAEEKSSDSESSHASEGEPVFHHPFEIKQRPDHIVMNIKNAMALKTRTFQEKTTEQSKTLSLQFPVSSGTQHRRTESEWVPVTTSVPSIMPAPTPTTTTAQPSTPGSNIRAPPAPMELNFSAVALPGAPPLSTQLPLAPAPAAAPVQAPLAIEPAPAGPQPAVFTEPDPDVMNMDIGAVVSQRLKAMRRLAENPHDSEAQIQMYHAQKKMKAWAESKQMPGQFTGSTEVRILTPQELAAGSQAWARKEQFVEAAPVSGGMGMHLLQKMGWQPGEGLGKNKEGTVQPLSLDIKFDRRGLVSKEELPPQRKNPYVYRRNPNAPPQPPPQSGGAPPPPRKAPQMSLEGKHPVSLLHEYCMRRKLGVPRYEQVSESGPPHRKNFVFKEILPLILATRQPAKAALIASRQIELEREENKMVASEQDGDCHDEETQDYNDRDDPNNSTENYLPSHDNSDDIFKRFSREPRENDTYHFYNPNNYNKNKEQIESSNEENYNRNMEPTESSNISNTSLQPNESRSLTNLSSCSKPLSYKDHLLPNNTHPPLELASENNKDLPTNHSKDNTSPSYSGERKVVSNENTVTSVPKKHGHVLSNTRILPNNIINNANNIISGTFNFPTDLAATIKQSLINASVQTIFESVNSPAMTTLLRSLMLSNTRLSVDEMNAINVICETRNALAKSAANFLHPSNDVNNPAKQYEYVQRNPGGRPDVISVPLGLNESNSQNVSAKCDKANDLGQKANIGNKASNTTNKPTNVKPSAQKETNKEPKCPDEQSNNCDNNSQDMEHTDPAHTRDLAHGLRRNPPRQSRDPRVCSSFRPTEPFRPRKIQPKKTKSGEMKIRSVELNKKPQVQKRVPIRFDKNSDTEIPLSLNENPSTSYHNTEVFSPSSIESGEIESGELTDDDDQPPSFDPASSHKNDPSKLPNSQNNGPIGRSSINKVVDLPRSRGKHGGHTNFRKTTDHESRKNIPSNSRKTNFKNEQQNSKSRDRKAYDGNPSNSNAAQNEYKPPDVEVWIQKNFPMLSSNKHKLPNVHSKKDSNLKPKENSKGNSTGSKSQSKKDLNLKPEDTSSIERWIQKKYPTVLSEYSSESDRNDSVTSNKHDPPNVRSKKDSNLKGKENSSVDLWIQKNYPMVLSEYSSELDRNDSVPSNKHDLPNTQSKKDSNVKTKENSTTSNSTASSSQTNKGSNLKATSPIENKNKLTHGQKLPINSEPDEESHLKPKSTFSSPSKNNDPKSQETNSKSNCSFPNKKSEPNSQEPNLTSKSSSHDENSSFPNKNNEPSSQETNSKSKSSFPNKNNESNSQELILKSNESVILKTEDTSKERQAPTSDNSADKEHGSNFEAKDLDTKLESTYDDTCDGYIPAPLVEYDDDMDSASATESVMEVDDASDNKLSTKSEDDPAVNQLTNHSGEAVNQLANDVAEPLNQLANTPTVNSEQCEKRNEELVIDTATHDIPKLKEDLKDKETGAECEENLIVQSAEENTLDSATEASVVKEIVDLPASSPALAKKSNIFTRLDPLISDATANVTNTEQPEGTSSNSIDVSNPVDKVAEKASSPTDLNYHSEGEISLSDEDSIYSTSHLIGDSAELEEMPPLVDLSGENFHIPYSSVNEMYPIHHAARYPYNESYHEQRSVRPPRSYSRSPNGDMRQYSLSPPRHDLRRSPNRHEVLRHSRSPGRHEVVRHSRSPTRHEVLRHSRSPIRHEMLRHSHSPGRHEVLRHSRSPARHEVLRHSHSPNRHEVLRYSPDRHEALRRSSDRCEALRHSHSPGRHEVLRHSHSPTRYEALRHSPDRYEELRHRNSPVRHMRSYSRSPEPLARRYSRSPEPLARSYSRSPNSRIQYRRTPSPEHFMDDRLSLSPDRSFLDTRPHSPSLPERIVRRSPTPEEVDLRTYLQSLQAPQVPAQDELEPILCEVYNEPPPREDPDEEYVAALKQAQHFAPVSTLKVSVSFEPEDMYEGRDDRRSPRHYRMDEREYRHSEYRNEYRSPEHHVDHRHDEHSNNYHRSNEHRTHREHSDGRQRRYPARREPDGHRESPSYHGQEVPYRERDRPMGRETYARGRDPHSRDRGRGGYSSSHTEGSDRRSNRYRQDRSDHEIDKSGGDEDRELFDPMHARNDDNTAELFQGPSGVRSDQYSFHNSREKGSSAPPRRGGQLNRPRVSHVFRTSREKQGS